MRSLLGNRLRLLCALGALVAAVAISATACAGEVVTETVVVRETVVVPGEVVRETVVVPGQVVRETVVVVATPTAVAPTAQPSKGTGQGVPQPKSPAGTLVMIPENIPAGVGLNRSQAPEMLMYWGVSEQLFRPTGTDLITPWLAESWESNADGSKVTVKIRSGVQFHQGWGELTASDIAWSLNDTNAVVTPESIHGQSGDFAVFLDAAEAIDDRTLVLNFTAPEPRWTTLLFNMAGDSFSIFSKKAYDEKGADWMRENIIGTGPYEVQEWTQQDRALLTAVSDHWDKVGEAKTLRVIDVPETSARVAALRTGEADWSELPVRELPPLTADGFKVAKTGRQNGVPLNMAGNYWEATAAKTGEALPRTTFVHDIPWIGNPWVPNDANNPAGIDDMEQARLVRWAVAMSIDRDLLNESVYGGNATPYYTAMFHPIDKDWDDKWKVDYDPAKAKEYLDKAGYAPDKDGVRFEMPIFAITTTRDWGELADSVSGFLGDIGIKAEVIKIAYPIVRPSLVGRTVTVPGTQWCRSDVWFPYDWVRGEEETSLTRGGFGCYIESPFILDIVRKVSAEPDTQKRIELNKQLADYLWEQQVKVAIIALPVTTVYNPKSIADWPMRRAPFGPFNSPELIKLVPR